MATIGDRIDAGLEALGLSQAKLADLAKLPSPNYVSRIKSGELIGRKYLKVIATVLETNVEWLTVGSGQVPTWWHGAVRRPITIDRLPNIEDSHPLDVVGVVTAGDGDLTRYEELDEPRHWQIPKAWKIVQVFGKSAYPVIFEGQWAAIDTNRAQRPPFSPEAHIDLHDNIVLIQTDDGRGFLKRYCHAPGAPGDFILASIDGGKSSPFVPPESIIVVAPVVGTFFVDPSQPRTKRWHNKTVTVDHPGEQ